MPRTTYIAVIAALLLASSAVHLAAPRQTELWMSRVPVVRSVGALLLLGAVPCLAWRGWYFWSLFAGLSVSGAWRLLAPRHSIRAQQWSYPRWVHGCLLAGGAILVWALRP